MADATGNRKKVFTRRNLIISGVLLLIALVVGLNIYRVMNRCYQSSDGEGNRTKNGADGFGVRESNGG